MKNLLAIIGIVLCISMLYAFIPAIFEEDNLKITGPCERLVEFYKPFYVVLWSDDNGLEEFANCNGGK